MSMNVGVGLIGVNLRDILFFYIILRYCHAELPTIKN